MTCPYWRQKLFYDVFIPTDWRLLSSIFHNVEDETIELSKRDLLRSPTRDTSPNDPSLTSTGDYRSSSTGRYRDPVKPSSWTLGSGLEVYSRRVRLYIVSSSGF